MCSTRVYESHLLRTGEKLVYDRSEHQHRAIMKLRLPSSPHGAVLEKSTRNLTLESAKERHPKYHTYVKV